MAETVVQDPQTKYVIERFDQVILLLVDLLAIATPVHLVGNKLWSSTHSNHVHCFTNFRTTPMLQQLGLPCFNVCQD